MIGRTASALIPGPAGELEVVVEGPDAAQARGLVVIAHPHPLMGGTLDNKVVHTLARAFVAEGWQAVRFNFRGVGQSTGTWDEGRGEVDDLLAVVTHHQAAAGEPTPLALAGFSFGGYAAAAAAHRLEAQGQPVRPLVLVSPAVSKNEVPDVAPHALVVQGDQDDVVPLDDVLAWAQPQGLPVTVVPQAGHFFHGQLGVLKQHVLDHLQAARPAPTV